MTIESARRDLHSGNFAAPNPNWRLAGLLSSMAAPDGTQSPASLERVTLDDIRASIARTALSGEPNDTSFPSGDQERRPKYQKTS